MENSTIYHDVFIDSSEGQLFENITSPKHLNNWWTAECEGVSILDSTYRFYFTPEYDWLATVSKIQQNKSIEFKMVRADEDWKPTSFGFEIEILEKGCMLHFYHTNWKIKNHHFKRTSYCWALLLHGLKNYTEKGIILPFEQRA